MFFPVWNASLNALSGLLLLCGYINIRRGNVQIHKRFMLSACIASDKLAAAQRALHAAFVD